MSTPPPLLGGIATLDVLDRLSDGVYVCDRDRRIVWWNGGAEAITGYSRNEVVGRHCRDNLLRHVDGTGRLLCLEGCPMAATIADGSPRTAEVFLHHRLGHRVPVRVQVLPIMDGTGTILGSVEIFSDASTPVAAQRTIEELRALALLDPLTGLGNRRYAETTLARKLEELHRYGWRLGVAFLDIDHFKQVNDQHGHATGDEALKMVARTLQHAARAADFLSRWGGEEFVVLLSAVGATDLLPIADRFRALVGQSALTLPEGNRLLVTVSAGATQARPGDSPETVMSRADELLYRAKAAGRNRVVVDA
ncbi:MAG: diguanylate cyclase [Thermoanaerobaculia bacterium]